MTDLARAIALLQEDPSRTCAFVCGEEFFTSTRRGVAPLLEFALAGRSLKNFSCADRVVGRAAALLYSYLGAKAVYAEVMSVSAEEIFTAQKITYVAKNLVQNIINRQGTGLCPMELATQGITQPEAGVRAIAAQVEALKAAESTARTCAQKS